MNLAVIVRTHSNWPDAIRCLRSLFATTPRVLAIVIDDASEDWNSDYPARINAIQPGRIAYQRFQKRSGAARCWNAGLRLCRQLRVRFTVTAKSDIIFAPGWWPALENALLQSDSAATFCGPVSNASGTCRRQHLSEWLTQTTVRDTDIAVATVAANLASRYSVGDIEPTGCLQGFCVAGRTEDYWLHSISASDVFNPESPHEEVDHEFFARAARNNALLQVVPNSFVFCSRADKDRPRDLSEEFFATASLPGMESLLPVPIARPTGSAGRTLRPECVHLGRLTSPVHGLAPCRQMRWCEHFGRAIRRCVDCEQCPAHEAV